MRPKANELVHKAHKLRPGISSGLQAVKKKTDTSLGMEKCEVMKEKACQIVIDLEHLTYFPPRPSIYDSVHGYKKPGCIKLAS